MKTKVSIITVVLSTLQTSPDQFRVFKSGSLLSIFESISPFCIRVLYMYWYCWYIGTSHSVSVPIWYCCLYVPGTVGTVGTLVPVTLSLYQCYCMVLHWYCSLYVMVQWVLLVHWYRPLYVAVAKCYRYCTGTAVYMYW